MLSWLSGHRFVSATKREHDWSFNFDRDVHFVIGCLWRLVQGETLRWTSEDDGHKYGLPAPVDATKETEALLTGAEVVSVSVTSTDDVSVLFSNGVTLQVIPNSSGYENWNVYTNGCQYIESGGHKIDIWRPSPS
ncbi:MAG: hypothetical protein GIKADHBN_00199 [Phycisphaerales bacterium]|nr:hypothetical protein [Phycisphaerales bacterium]